MDNLTGTAPEKKEGKKKISIYTIAAAALMAALVFVGCYITITIPTPLKATRFHFGNVFCVLAGLLFGPWSGGVAGGVGSAFFDLTNPLYVSDAPITFINKFFIGFLAGWISHRKGKAGKSVPANILGGAVGSVAYIVLYLGKTFLWDIFFEKVEMATALTDIGIKLFTSTVNGVLAVVIAVPLAMAIRPALVKSGLMKK